VDGELIFVGGGPERELREEPTGKNLFNRAARAQKKGA